MIKGIAPPTVAEIAKKNKFDENYVLEKLSLIKKSMVPLSKRIYVEGSGTFLVSRKGIGILTTKYGDFWMYDFEIDDKWGKYSVLVKSEIDVKTLNPIFRSKSLLLRTDSGCETGQMFHDLTCECREQLDLTMELILKNGEGLIVNIPRQDGRGMGLPFKLATLWAQRDLNLHTIESASLLSDDGFIDKRTYSGVICILKYFGIGSGSRINLATNNPDKMMIFSDNGYLLESTPVVIEHSTYTKKHLKAKKDFLGHGF